MVVVDGVTITVAELAGAVPELAVHTKGADPLEESVAVCPAQIVVKEGVILMAGVNEIETVATADEVQVPTPETTV